VKQPRRNPSSSLSQKIDGEATAVYPAGNENTADSVYGLPQAEIDG